MLGPVDVQFEKRPGLRRLDLGRRALRHKLSRHHHAEAIALLRLFQVVRGDQNRGAGVGETIDEAPEGAARQGIDTRGRLVEKQHARLVHDRRAEGDPLLPAAGQARDHPVAFLLQTREPQHPVDFLVALLVRDAVHAGKEREVLGDRHVLVERELLRHVAHLPADLRRAQVLPRTGELGHTTGRIQQPAEHLDRGRLAGAVGPEQPVHLTVFHLQRQVVNRAEGAERPRDVFRADRHLAAGARAVAPARKHRVLDRAAERPQLSDERILQRRRIRADVGDRQARLPEPLADHGLAGRLVVHEHVEAVAEALDVDDVGVVAVRFVEDQLGRAQARRPHLEPRGPQAVAERGRRADLLKRARVHQRDTVAALGLVEVRRRDQDGQAVGRQVRQRVPELSPRHRVHAGRRLVKQQHARLGHERTGQGQLLLHAAAQLPGAPGREAMHVEHAQIAHPALVDLTARRAAQVAEIADVLHHGQVRIEAEGLREIPGVLAGVARGLAEDLRHAAAGLHHARQHLERAGLAGAIRADQAEDLALGDLEADAAHRFEAAVALDETVDADRRRRTGRRRLRRHRLQRHCHRVARAGQLPPTRISPSAGMPGFAKPTAPFNCTFTPTTCFTRSSRK